MQESGEMYLETILVLQKKQQKGIKQHKMQKQD